MFRISVEVSDDIDAKKFVADLKKQKGVTKITLAKKKKADKKMTDYHTVDGKQLSVSEFKKRIRTAEKDIKEGRFYTQQEMEKLWETKKKKLIK